MKHRIYLRALEPSDYEVSVKWRNDPEIQSMVGGHSYFVASEKEKEWVHNTIFNNDKIVLAVCLIENDKYIGNVILQGIDYINGAAETAMLIGTKEDWGKGYATEALFMILKFAFEERRLNRLFAIIKEDNIASIRMHEKCGYQKEGVMRESIFKNGKYYNQVIMAVLKEDFDEAYRKYIEKFN